MLAAAVRGNSMVNESQKRQAIVLALNKTIDINNSPKQPCMKHKVQRNFLSSFNLVAEKTV